MLAAGEMGCIEGRQESRLSNPAGIGCIATVEEAVRFVLATHCPVLTLRLCVYARLAAVAGAVLVMMAPFTPDGKNPPLVALAFPPKAR